MKYLWRSAFKTETPVDLGLKEILCSIYSVVQVSMPSVGNCSNESRHHPGHGAQPGSTLWRSLNPRLQCNNIVCFPYVAIAPIKRSILFGCVLQWLFGDSTWQVGFHRFHGWGASSSSSYAACLLFTICLSFCLLGEHKENPGNFCSSETAEYMLLLWFKELVLRPYLKNMVWKSVSRMWMCLWGIFGTLMKIKIWQVVRHWKGDFAEGCPKKQYLCTVSCFKAVLVFMTTKLINSKPDRDQMPFYPPPTYRHWVIKRAKPHQLCHSDLYYSIYQLRTTPTWSKKTFASILHFGCKLKTAVWAEICRWKRNRPERFIVDHMMNTIKPFFHALLCFEV